MVEELHQLSAFSEPLEAVAEASLQRLGSSGSVTLLQVTLQLLSAKILLKDNTNEYPKAKCHRNSS